MNRETLQARGFLGPEFNNFLFASVGVDQRGGPLSVVSALARLDLDAWAEAAKLARLPREAAAASLSRLIERLTEAPLIVRDAKITATRLVVLLPAPVALLGTSRRFPAGMSWYLGLGMVIIVAMLAWQMGTHPPGGGGGAPVPAPKVAPP